MDFRVLGPIEVREGQRAVDLGAQKPRAVLALLIMSANHVVPLDRLADDLWEGRPPATATTALQGYVSSLRRALEPGRPPGAQFDVLVTQAPGYVLRARAEQVDALRFEALVASGRRDLDAGRPGPARDTLDRALGLWRGSAYADFAYRSFAQGEIGRLAELRALAQEGRAEADLALGGHVAAVPDLERLANAEPLRETRWELLALALYRSGRQADALRALARARRILSDDLGVDPGAALRSLEERILCHSPTLDWRAAPVMATAGSGTARTPSAEGGNPEPEPTLPLVGRDAEVALLETALGEAAQGRRRTVLVSGEPGIGKTRLVEEFVRLARARVGTALALGRCPEAEGAPPYWPWGQVLAEIVSSDDPTVRAALEPVASEIAQLVPAVKELVDDIVPPPALDPSAARFRFHRAVAAFLRGVASARPLVVVLEDVHWADPESAELLKVVSAEVTGAVVVVTYRDVDAAPERLADLLGALAANGGAGRIRLRGLGVGEAGQLVALATGAHPSQGALVSLRDRTEGNPFFVLEVAREGRWDADHDGAVAVPEAIADVIRRRLGRLPELTRGLLDVAAIAGRDFDLAVIAAAAGMDEEAALAGVDVALAAGLVVDDRIRPGRYRFSHALVPETIAHGLSALRRARLHARVGEAMEARPAGTGRLSELAHHFAEAAVVIGPNRGIRYAIGAAQDARARLAHASAQAHLERALALIDTLPPGTERDHLALEATDALASLLVTVTGLAAPGELWSRAFGLCRDVEDHHLVLRSLWGVALASMARGDLDTADGLAAQTLALGHRSTDPAIALAADVLAGSVALLRGELAHAAARLARAVWLVPDPARTAASPTVPDWRAQALGCRSLVSWLRGEEDQAEAAGAAALERAREVGEPVGVALALLLTGLVACVAGDAPAATDRAGTLAAHAGAHGMADFLAHARIMAGWAGPTDPDIAAPEVEDALRSLQASGFRAFTPLYLGLLADVHARAGRDDEALAAVHEALAAANGSGERFYEAELHRRRAELARRQGASPSVARASLREAVAAAVATGAEAFRRRAEAALGELLNPSPPA